MNLAEARATATAADASREAAASEARATEASLRESANDAAAARAELDAKLRHAEDRARSAEEALAAHRGEQQSGQARALMLQAEASELRAKVEKRNREVRELNQMLKAWEAMRHSKDKQIAELVERCRKFEEEAAEKSRAVEAMRRRVGRERSGSGSIEHTPTSVTRSVGRSQRAPKSATSAASSFAFGTSGRISVASRPSPVAFGQENPNAFGSASPAVKAFAGTAVESEGGRRFREKLDSAAATELDASSVGMGPAGRALRALSPGRGLSALR